MPDIKISELTPAASLNIDDVMPVVQELDGNLTTMKCSMSQIGTEVNKNILYSSDLMTEAKSVIGAINEIAFKTNIPTDCSISRGSSMPATFPVPTISRRGNTVIISFAILLPAGSYTSTQVLWNYTPVMTDFVSLTIPVYGSGEVKLLKILPDGTISLNNNKTFANDTWLIGEAVFNTDG